MENLPVCGEQWIAWSTTVVSFVLFLASETLGVLKGKGGCASLIQLCASAYHKCKNYYFPTPIPTQKSSAEWLNQSSNV